jgi:ATP/maltotriose-dependent transcriptional regulator MalT/DNA-binding SARP family transcriptional activator
VADSDAPIGKTKIILPRRRPELLSRARLLEILYERLDRRLIIVSAPAGYGKTSLLIDLAHQSELTFCWLALDPLDRDPQRFVSYLIAAIAERFPHFGARTRAILNGLTSLEEGWEPLLVTFINEIHDEIPEHFVVVLDDFQFLDGAPAIQAFINRFIQLMDESCHVVLASRTLPEIPDIARLVARDEVGGLDFSDLAFHQLEVQALFAQNQQLELSDDEARRLTEATEGWIAGIQFADVGRLRGGEDPFRAVHAVGVSVFDYLGQQVVDQQDPELKVFLLRSSLLEEFDAAMCEAVLGPLYGEPQDWGRLLEQIRQKNLYVLPVGPDGKWLRYHHLFRDYLQSRYRDEYASELRPAVRRLAGFREGQGEYEAAYQLYNQLDDRDALADMIERAGTPMYRSALLTLESWLNALPPSLVRQRPRLLSLSGAVEYVRGHAADAVRHLDAAIRQLATQGDTPALALARIRRGHAHFFLGSYEQAIRDANAALKMTEDNDSSQDLYADALRLRGLSRYRQGRSLQAVEDLERALTVYVRTDETFSIPHLMMETAMVHAALGEYRRAKASYDKAFEIWKASANLFYQANLLNNYGVLHHQLGEYEAAAQALEEGLLCSRQSGYKRMEALISISLADMYAEIEDFEIAGQHYRNAESLVQQLRDRFLTSYLWIAQANLALLKREPSRAREILQSAASHVRASDSRYEFGHLQLSRGRLALQEGDGKRAEEYLTEAKRCFTEDGREMECTWGSIWLAAALARRGETARAVQEITTAVPSQNQIGHTAVVAARQAVDWLEPLRKDREARPAIRGLLDRADRLDDQLPGVRRQLRRMGRIIEAPAPTLTVHAFGRGQVWINGRLVSASEWQTQAVRELFFYFLAMNRPVSKEQIGSVLWPEAAEPARLRLRFKNEMYRLRRAVGHDTILFEDDYYQLNPAADHEYDVEAFEAYLARARASSLPAERIRFYEQATELASGEYLEDFDALWVVTERERLHQEFVAGALTLAELHFADGQSAKALQACDHILKREPTCEAAYRLKMNVHRRLGDKAALIRTYEVCEQSLQGVIGQPPSDETRELFLKLVA